MGHVTEQRLFSGHVSTAADSNWAREHALPPPSDDACAHPGRALQRLRDATPPFSLPIVYPSGRAEVLNRKHALVDRRADGPLEAAGYQFYAHMEGRTYSQRLKNVLLLGALAVWVDYRTVRGAYHEYWYTLLEPLDDFIWLLNASSAPSPFAPDPQDARRKAERASDLAAQVLAPSAIRRFVRMLLTGYAKLQSFLPADLPQGGFVHVTRASLDRSCTCARAERALTFTSESGAVKARSHHT